MQLLSAKAASANVTVGIQRPLGEAGSRQPTLGFPTMHIFWIKRAQTGVLAYREEAELPYFLWPTWSRGRQQW